LTRVHFKKILKKFKNNSKKIKIKIQKNSKKPQNDTWQSLFMAINDLNGISKKGTN